MAILAIFAYMLVLTGCELTTNKKATKATSSRTSSSTSTTTDVVTTPTTKTVLVSWAANREQAVNTTGGGYKVYFSTTSGFSLSSAFYVSVPYVSGASTPTNVSIPALTAGTYFFVVVAYSALNATGTASAQTSLVVP